MVHVKWVNLTNKNVDDQSLGYSLFEKEFLFEFALGMVYLSDYWLDEVTKVVVWLSLVILVIKVTFTKDFRNCCEL